MKVGFYYKDSGLKSIDMSQPEMGNPGIGGTQFCFLITAAYLLRYTDHKVVLYHFNDNILPRGIASALVKDESEVIQKAVQDRIDVLIYQNGNSSTWFDELNKTDLKCICWCHNYLKNSELNMLSGNKNTRRIVFVGREHCEFYYDHSIYVKSTFIYNMFNADLPSYKRQSDYKNVVTYTGSLVWGKGFHVLAKVWKDILKAVPDAELNVLGTGNLYSRNSSLGYFNLADEKYEKFFIKYLVDDCGKILPSVQFLGVLGKEKDEIYNNTAVGVVNPTGNTETFCLSAVEMEACGVPIVTKRVHGLLDTVKHKQTGLMFRSEFFMKRYIIMLLKNRKLNQKLGIEAKSFVLREFHPELLIKQWDKLIYDILLEKENYIIEPNKHWFNDLKWLKVINKRRIKCFKMSKGKSVFEITEFLKDIIKVLVRKN